MYFREFLYVKQTNQCGMIDLLQACRSFLRPPPMLPSSVFIFLFPVSTANALFSPMWPKHTKYYRLRCLPWLSSTFRPSLRITETHTVSVRWRPWVVSIYWLNYSILRPKKRSWFGFGAWHRQCSSTIQFVQFQLAMQKRKINPETSVLYFLFSITFCYIIIKKRHYFIISRHYI